MRGAGLKIAGLKIVGAVWLGAAVADDPVEGTWKALPDDNGNTPFAPCGDRNCAPLKSPDFGKKIACDMVDRGKGHYGGGRIQTSDSNKTCASVMDLKGEALSVAGCIAFGPIRRSQSSPRVT